MWIFMLNNLSIQNANWTCPYIEKNRYIPIPDQKTLASFCNAGKVKRLMEENRQVRCLTGEPLYILPVWQNLESIVYGTRLLNDGSYFTPSEYCTIPLSDVRKMDFDLLSDPMIQALIRLIPFYSDKRLLLMVESPFTILSAMINPVDLYSCFEEEGDLLKEILHKIAEASAKYIKACIDAGCRMISLADPAGTLDLVGERYYKEFSGESELYLLKKCQPHLDHSIIHICRKMSQSLLVSGMISCENYQGPDRAGDSHFMASDMIEALDIMAGDENIHFTGMACIHNDLHMCESDLTKLIIKPAQVRHGRT